MEVQDDEEEDDDEADGDEEEEDEEDDVFRFDPAINAMFIVGAGETWQYDIPKSVNGIGSVTTSVSYDEGQMKFMTYDSSSKSFVIEQDATGESDIGEYKIDISLTD